MVKVAYTVVVQTITKELTDNILTLFRTKEEAERHIHYLKSEGLLGVPHIITTKKVQVFDE